MKKGLTNNTARAATALLVGSSVVAQGGGLAASEFAIPANGAALAGQAALASDASTVFLNPAGMTRLESSQALFGLQVEYLRLKFEPHPGTQTSGGGGQDAGDWLPGASMHAVFDVSPDWKAGLSVTFPFGNGIAHNREWAGRYSLIDGKLLVLDLQPSLAYRINEHISIGAGANVQYARVDNSFAADLSAFSMPDDFFEVSADGWAVGATAGLLIEPSDSTRIGLRYRSSVHHDLDGRVDSESGISMPVTAELNFPHSFNLSGYQEVSDSWAILADVEWSDWSSFTTPQFQDTWRGGLGLHYRPNDRWLLQTGVAWDSSAHRDNERTLLVATDRQFRFSAGAEYQYTDGTRVGMNTTFADLGPNRTDVLDPNGSRVVGEYDEWKATLALYCVVDL